MVFFFVLIIVIIIVVFFFFAMVMGVELVGEGNSVVGVVSANANADEGSIAKPAKAAIAVREPGSGILDIAQGCRVVCGASAIRTAP